MNAPVHITLLLSSIAVQLPILLVCLGGGALVLTRYRQMGPGGLWALLGFGLGAVLCLLVPAVQSGVQAWVMESGGNMSQRAGVFSALSVLWSLLRAVSYGFLLIALLVGRSKSEPGVPHPA
jgi:hypothetical protein